MLNRWIVRASHYFSATAKATPSTKNIINKGKTTMKLSLAALLMVALASGPNSVSAQSCSTQNCKGKKVCCPEYFCDAGDKDKCKLVPTPPPTDAPTGPPVPTDPPTDPPTNSPTTSTPTNCPTTEAPTPNPGACTAATYFPGMLNVQCDGLVLSEGLDCRRIATTGQKVQASYFVVVLFYSMPRLHVLVCHVLSAMSCLVNTPSHVSIVAVVLFWTVRCRWRVLREFP